MAFLFTDVCEDRETRVQLVCNNELSTGKETITTTGDTETELTYVSFYLWVTLSSQSFDRATFFSLFQTDSVIICIICFI